MYEGAQRCLIWADQHHNLLFGSGEGHVEQTPFRFHFRFGLGSVMRPHLVESTEDHDGFEFFPLRPSSCHQVQRPLVQSFWAFVVLALSVELPDAGLCLLYHLSQL